MLLWFTFCFNLRMWFIHPILLLFIYYYFQFTFLFFFREGFCFVFVFVFFLFFIFYYFFFLAPVWQCEECCSILTLPCRGIRCLIYADSINSTGCFSFEIIVFFIPSPSHTRTHTHTHTHTHRERQTLFVTLLRDWIDMRFLKDSYETLVNNSVATRGLCAGGPSATRWM